MVSPVLTRPALERGHEISPLRWFVAIFRPATTTAEAIRLSRMSQYLSLLTSFVAFFASNPAAAAKLWQAIVSAYEAAQKLADVIEDSLGGAIPRDAGASLTEAEEEAQREFDKLAGVARGPFGNGKILRWLLTSEVGKQLLPLLLSQFGKIGS